MTCAFSESPHPDQGLRKWVQYDLGNVLLLGETWIWNINSVAHLGRGVKELEVYYSVDGVAYDLLGSFDIEAGNGSSLYSGQFGPDFSGVAARFILFHLISNHENTGCIGFGEVRFETLGIPSSVSDISDDSFRLYPNPTSDVLYVESSNSEVSQSYQILDAMGTIVFSDKLNAGSSIDVSRLPTGLYYLQLLTLNELITKKFSVIHD